ncbi:tRNA guanosine(34) transglycosylase Tgt [Hyphobacterium sp.]|uniref:tRNA guanosine(34) transglycosylase Tgt n=1 Tax=Hyphobacterium sp. TaxID=2004662 RepID=UPI003BA8B212
MSAFDFDLHATDGAARTGVLKTARGDIRTPAFMPVGTAATVKALYPEQVRAAGADIILGNTYHLMLRPGAERIKRLGGLHEFMRWDGPILTDSGGFQVWSLANLRKLTEAGVEFQSHIDGSKHQLTPERAVEIQADLLGADISMQLDECTNFPCTEDEARTSMELSLRWGERCKSAFGERRGQALFGIVQGAVFEALRKESAQRTIETGFDGYAIGGLAVGEGREMMCNVLDFTVAELPASRPRYLMGVGKPIDLVEAVARGIDMFDCVMPTRSGRHGQAWSDYGPVNLKRAEFAEDPAPLNPEIDCPASCEYSKAYLHHLVRAGEYLAAMLISWHNVAYYEHLMARMRAAIREQRFGAFASEFRTRWAEGETRQA